MKTADPELMRAINRFHVMDAIRRWGPLSRVEISQRTELSPTTVSAITAALLDDRLIATLHLGAVRDPARGRPRVMLSLNPGAARVVGVRLAPDRIAVAVTDFCAQVLATSVAPARLERASAALVAESVEAGVRRCVEAAGLVLPDMAGICVGLPGVVERASGLCRQSPLFAARDIAFAAELTRRLGAPVGVDSDVNLAALAEHWFGASRDLDHFLVVGVERHLGLAIVHNGELFRGAKGLSADFGEIWSAPPREGGRRLGDLASESSVLQGLRDILGEDPEFLQALGAGQGLALGLARAEAGDVRCRDLLGAAGRAMGLAIANLITLFAPARVILCGGALAAHPLFLTPLRAAVAELLPASLADLAEIVAQDWGDDVWVRGAAAMTLRDLYGAPWSTTGPAPGRPV